MTLSQTAFAHRARPGVLAIGMPADRKNSSINKVEVYGQRKLTDRWTLNLNEHVRKGIGFAAPNYTAQCLAAKQAGATAMSVGDASSIVVKVAQDCATQGV